MFVTLLSSFLFFYCHQVSPYWGTNTTKRAFKASFGLRELSGQQNISVGQTCVWSSANQQKSYRMGLMVRTFWIDKVDAPDWSPLRWSLQTRTPFGSGLHCVCSLGSGQTWCQSTTEALGSLQTALGHSHCRRRKEYDWQLSSKQLQSQFSMWHFEKCV